MGLIIPVFLYSFVYMYSFTKWLDNIKHCQPNKHVLGIIHLTGCSWILLSMTFDIWMRFYILILVGLITRTGRRCESI